MDQLLLLLKGKCEFCGHLKLAPVKVSRFIYKLRLIQHGLLKESHDLEEFLSTPKSHSQRMSNGVEEQASASEEESDAGDIVARLENFVNRAIEKAKSVGGNGSKRAEKVGAIGEERRAVVKEFLAAIKKARTCGRCKG